MIKEPVEHVLNASHKAIDLLFDVHNGLYNAINKTDSEDMRKEVVNIFDFLTKEALTLWKLKNIID
jgi:hypothetical protein